MHYLFKTPIPVSWLLIDILTLVISLLLFASAVHITLLGFIFYRGNKVKLNAGYRKFLAEP